MGSSWDRYYDSLEEERSEALAHRAKKTGRTPSEQREYERYMGLVEEGRKLYEKKQREEELITMYLTHKNIEALEKVK